MLAEGHRRAARGTDVIVGAVEDHGRLHTRAAVVGLPLIAPTVLAHHGAAVTEMDTDAILARHPQVALVDELAHTNAPGSSRAKRWQDIEVLLDAGIDVITTVNVANLESLNDAVTGITGVKEHETVPDVVVRSADAIELVDMSPQALRRRLAHGHIYPSDSGDSAPADFFREGTLTALRELALLWVADRVEEGLDRYREQHGIAASWSVREKIVVALPGTPVGSRLLRRGARIAGRGVGGSLFAVHVVRAVGTAGADATVLQQQRQLTEELGGSFHVVIGDDPTRAILEFARSVNATQVVIGASTHGRLRTVMRRSSMTTLAREARDIDVHMVSHSAAEQSRSGPAWRGRPAGSHGVLAWIAALVVPVALSGLLLIARDQLNLPTVLLVLLLGVLGNALLGGVVPATVAAVVAGLLANLLFTPPYGSLLVGGPDDVVALASFVVVAVVVASVVDRSTARARAADRGLSAAQLIASLVTSMSDAEDPVATVLDAARVGFGMASTALWRRTSAPFTALESYELVARSGPPEVGAGGGRGPAEAVGPGGAVGPVGAVGPAGADVVERAGDHLLALDGRPLTVADQRLAAVFAAQADQAAQRRRLADEAALSRRLRETDSVRTAILAALSHDLRNPLATISAAVSSLRDPTINLSPDDSRQLLDTAAEAVDILDALLANLLDLSRLQTGAVAPVRRPVAVDEVVLRALLGLRGCAIVESVPDDLPLVDTDAGLLERVLANVIGNDCRYSPAGRPVRVDACRSMTGNQATISVRVVDHGPGVPAADRQAMFAPFQRLGDVPAGSGVGLGLAVARGLADSVGVTIDADDTPGGGLTMTLTIPVARSDSDSDSSSGSDPVRLGSPGADLPGGTTRQKVNGTAPDESARSRR